MNKVILLLFLLLITQNTSVSKVLYKDTDFLTKKNKIMKGCNTYNCKLKNRFNMYVLPLTKNIKGGITGLEARFMVNF